MPPKYAANTSIRIFGGEIKINMSGRGIEAWQNRVNDYAAAAKDMRPAFRAFGAYFLRSIDRNFGAGGRPKWQPLSPKYAAWKARNYPGWGILELTGAMRRSFGFRATNKTLQFTNSRQANGVSLFPIHQEGRGSMPRRQMVILQDRDKSEFTKIVRRHLYGE